MFDDNSYLVLQGHLMVFGIGGDYIGFYPQGCIFSNFCEGNFESKRLSNVFAKTYCTVGVLTVESMKKLKEAYPDWFTEFVEANKIALKL